MNSTQTGWMLFIGSMSMMCALLAVDIAKLMNWSDANSPAFVAEFIAHLGAVGAAFIGGKIIPSSPQ